MSFNELNNVEYYVINQLTGGDLYENRLDETKIKYGTSWRFQTSKELERGINEILVDNELKAALVRLNPEITINPDLADEA